MKKKVLIILMMVIMSVMPVTTNVYARGNLCSCGGTMQQYGTKQYSVWALTGNTRRCDHGKEGTDAEKSRSVTTNYKCNSCGRTTYTVATEKKWVCRGYTD